MPTEHAPVMKVPGYRRIQFKLDDSSLGFNAAVLILGWFCLLLYDLFIGGYLSSSPSTYGFLRLLLPLLCLIPTARRLLHPLDIENDREAYITYVRLTITSLILVVGVGAGQVLLPFSYTELAAPNSLWSFLTGRAISLVALICLPMLAESLLLLYRYRSRLSAPMFARYYAYGLIAIVLLAAVPWLSPIRRWVDLSEGVFIAGGLLGGIGLILSARGGWIINLRKKQKLRLLGISFVGIICGALMLSVHDSNDISGALLSLFPGLVALAVTIAISLIMTNSAVFFNALLSLPTADAIDRRNIEVSTLANFARLLTQSFDVEDLTSTAIAITCDVTGGAAAWIELVNGESHEILYGITPRLPVKIARHLMDIGSNGTTAVRQVVQERRRFQVVERVSGARWSAENGIVHELRSVAAAPLQSGEIVIGTLYVAKGKTDSFDREDLMILGAIADQIALAIEQSRLIRKSFERERFEQEMLIARDLQQRLLPKVMPQSIFHDIHAESEPASIVGGDYFDVVSFSDHTIGIIIADVSGKGASAALYMGMVKGIMQALSGACATPTELLMRANLALYGSIDHRWFVTMTCAQIIDEERTLRIARAGHCPTLFVRNGEGSYGKPSGIGLAIAKPILFDRNLELQEVNFSSGDYAVFFSDGLPEARDRNGEELGYDQLLDIVVRAAEGKPDSRRMRDAIFDEISTFTKGEPSADDSTIVIIRWQ